MEEFRGERGSPRQASTLWSHRDERPPLHTLNPKCSSGTFLLLLLLLLLRIIKMPFEYDHLYYLSYQINGTVHVKAKTKLKMEKKRVNESMRLENLMGTDLETEGEDNVGTWNYSDIAILGIDGT